MSTPLNTSLIKGFEILNLFSEQRLEISTGTVVEGTGMNASTAHRFLLSLEASGALRSTRRGRFSLGPLMVALGDLAMDQGVIANRLEDEIVALSNELEESVMICRFSSHGPECSSVVTYNRAITVNIKKGTVLPTFNTAQGKLWLAHMSEHDRQNWIDDHNIQEKQSRRKKQLNELEVELAKIVKQGYAVNLGENEPDIAAVSVPVMDAKGTMVFTISVFGMLSRFDSKLINRSRRELNALVNRVMG